MTDEMEALIEEYGDLEGVLQHFLDENQDFLSWLGTTVENIGHGTMTLSIPYDDKLTNVRPNAPDDRRADLHGGVAATLIDTVGGFSIRTAIEDAEPFSVGIATINLNVNYLRPATGDLDATANVIRVGQSVGVSEVTVESTTPDGETKAVATGQGAYRVFRHE